MMSSFLAPQLSRRTFTAGLAALPVAASLSSSLAASVTGPDPQTVADEAKVLDELHKAALAEGGKLVVYGGGDLPNGGAGMERAFATRFPGMTARIITDRSKFHGTRIDQQLALGRVECDVVHILTTHLYDDWKREGHLLPYRSSAWNALYPDFRDPDAAYLPMTVFAFGPVINLGQVKEQDAPRDFGDFLDPRWKGKIVLGYPQDDDALLYQYERIVAAYGWSFLPKLMSQDILWVRGSAPAREVVARGERAVTFCASGPLNPAADAKFKFLLPRKNDFLAWAQPVAIFRSSPRPSASKLYVEWLTSTAVQASSGRWPIRRDVPTPGGYGPISDYDASPQHFRSLLSDRARLERFRDQLEFYVGPIQGPNPTGVKGIYLLDS